MTHSYDSGSRPLTDVNYQAANAPYGSNNYNESTGYLPPQKPKKGLSNWIKFGIPVLIIVIAGAVVGGIVGSKKSNKSAAASGGSGGGNNPGAASSAISAKSAIGRFATATDTNYFMPVYPSTTNTAAFTTPTFVQTTNANIAWPADPFKPANPSPTTVRTDRPRLIAPAYKWAALPNLIKNDPYLSGWNDTIFGNASAYYPMPPVAYVVDGASGILDVSRSVKMRLKAFAYVYRMTNDTKWVDRAWSELQNAASFGPSDDKWNSGHFLDVAEMTAAFGIAYDWLYDVWTSDQKNQIKQAILTYGLTFGLNAQTNTSIGWWTTNVNGNWNCVCNGGLTIGALAILGDDTSGMATQILGVTVDNAKANCALGPSTDGTWSETANYWYFGTTGHAEMSSALLTATGSHYGLVDTNQNFHLTGLFHMYATGPTSLFNYGDHGPNKYSTTANAMLFYAEQYQTPEYALFQRDQHDAPEPWSMFWYDPTVSGAFWNGLPLDHFFDDGLDQWTSMRSSWTDNDSLYVAMKAGKNQGHQTHNDLDCGDFVLDAMGTRWAGELGSGDYLSPGYFSSDAQDSQRWLYYRKRTEGQNTILVNKQNQNVGAAPTVKHETTGEAQGSSTVYQDPGTSTAYWIADLSSAYADTSSFSRGVRMINGRKQVLIQDDITTTSALQWRMHTNATVSINGATATLTIGSDTMQVQILSPSGATFGQGPAQRDAADPTPPEADQPNPGVTVLTIDLAAGNYNLEVLFNPQWSGFSSFKTPPSVPLSGWTLTSHD
ncbi:hypothetical protein BD410DRAFT_739730 [Rickenella mellea]|uniref:Heparinase II/III family protein n=1 Tax=Rickenella mellea TaxID=50990 RepID=A0A4Y7QMP9_9AGAM|nr:hypothetical protein BD410DRAFT_739730 [Rickenella mellea]